MKTHIFSSTEEAYDMAMCGPDVKFGDVLLIPNENVVGVAFAWPFAVTPITGSLHGLVAGYVFEGKDSFLNTSIEEAKKHIYPVVEEGSYILVTEKCTHNEKYWVSCFVGTQCLTLGAIEFENGSWVIDPYVANFGDIVSFQSYASAMNALTNHFDRVKDGVVWGLMQEEV